MEIIMRSGYGDVDNSRLDFVLFPGISTLLLILLK